MEGLDSRACGRLVARGHNSPPDCCSVPLVLQVPTDKKNASRYDERLEFLVGVEGLEPPASCSQMIGKPYFIDISGYF